ncbi:hypothetical protein Bca4012_064309 [Brassica carinata]|uniref:Uncharacterized protein n=1 Tax=Brassica carinata TaxID=52824 RepID=A0A8X7V9Q2_BRACI|nr:hypothetical protein Bca52824_033892 [Brassica carinata]
MLGLVVEGVLGRCFCCMIVWAGALMLSVSCFRWAIIFKSGFIGEAKITGFRLSVELGSSSAASC